MKKIPWIAIVMAIVFFVGATAVSVSANSAQSRWEGVDQSGVLITDENCPIIVERELLTFDIQEFPRNTYRDITELKGYTGKVTAEYTFYNPADYTVTATLVFPFGKLPSYAYLYDEERGSRVPYPDTALYGITMNGEPIDMQVRHTFSYSYDQFELDKDLPLLVDGYIADAFYRPNLPVTVFKYRISGVDPQYDAATASFRWSGDSSKTRILLAEHNGGSLGDGWMSINMRADNGGTATVYLFGDVPAQGIQWTFYENGACEKEIDGTMTLEESKVMTFEEYAMRNVPDDADIRETDWYNAVVANLNRSAQGFSYGIIGECAEDLFGSLMRWYEYEITLEPGQRIVNTVTAPIYPSIDLQYEPAVFGYTYLLSPAKTWKSFGELEILIHTPYFISNCSIDGFAKTGTGYAVKLHGLPDEELTFSLSTSESLTRPVTQYQIAMISYIAIHVGIPLLLIGSIVVVIVLMVKRRKRAK